MALNPFHPDALDPIGKAVGEIKKGDLPGHVFHGNQYGEGSGGGGGDRPLHEQARSLANTVSYVRQHERENGTLPQSHEGAAQVHTEIGNRLMQAVRDAKADPQAETSQMVKDGIRGAELAANAHFAAAQAHMDIANGRVPYAAGDKQAQLDQAEALSHAAAALTDNPMQAGTRANAFFSQP